MKYRTTSDGVGQEKFPRQHVMQALKTVEQVLPPERMLTPPISMLISFAALGAAV